MRIFQQVLIIATALAFAACSSSDPPPDRVWYTVGPTTAPLPCLAKDDARVAGFLEKDWGNSGQRCVKTIAYGPETQDKDDQGNPARQVTCLYGVVWRDC
jgi:hypothetical protein